VSANYKGNVAIHFTNCFFFLQAISLIVISSMIDARFIIRRYYQYLLLPSSHNNYLFSIFFKK